MTDQGTFRERLEQVSDRRRRLRTLIEDNGWEWESDVLGRSGFRPPDDG